ncbi:MAG: hypothetical protein QM779_10440 [Propionicimonas sp.]|uniref:hypothetical protein n=1 Tax=Propionicimonas sp. TaxID=1955623 RepID=UPI003D0D828F
MSDEYGVYYTRGLGKRQVARARNLIWWRLGSMLFSAALAGAAWYFWPDQFGEWAPWVIGAAVVTGLVSVGLSVVQFVRVDRDAKLARNGLAIGLNRDGMLIGQRWLVWPEVGSVVVRPGTLGSSTSLVATARDNSTARVPLDYTDTMPATLDSAVRVLSSGRAWVDLSRLD